MPPELQRNPRQAWSGVQGSAGKPRRAGLARPRSEGVEEARMGDQRGCRASFSNHGRLASVGVSVACKHGQAAKQCGGSP